MRGAGWRLRVIVRRTVVIAPDSFKGSLSAREVAAAMADGWRSVRPGDRVIPLPQADGGEGTLDAVEAAVAGAVRHSAGTVTGPDGAPVEGEWLELPNGVAVVELAQMSGLPLMKSPDAGGATTTGLGEVIAAALDSGAQSLIMGLGGSASTDGGAGALTALGLRLLNADGHPVAAGGAGLAEIASIDLTGLRPPPSGGVILLSDVTAALCGPDGAAAVFGPQKGASPEQVRELDHALARFAELLGGDPGQPGSGAAGGTGYGFATAWGAELRSGADYLAELSGLPAAIVDADLVITGEGRFDSQSLGGKLIGQILRRGESAATPVLIIAGQSSVVTEGWQLSLVNLAGSVEAALREPRRWLVAAAARAATEFETEFDD